jgi:hypothetical protein
MLRRTLTVAVVLAALALGSAGARAAEIKLNSPQEGSTVHPGDTVKVLLKVTNDRRKEEVIKVKLKLIAVDCPFGLEKTFRWNVRLAPGESQKLRVQYTVPEWLPLLRTVPILCKGRVRGRKTGSKDRDKMTIRVAP